VTISGSHGRYDGTYTLSQVCRLCGELPPEFWMSGERAFVVEFPDGADFDISHVTFRSKTLVSGATSTDKFYLSVTVRTARGTRPPAYVLDTSQPNNTGDATLTVAAGKLTLKVAGTNSMKETIDRTVICEPAPSR
jgi:hypothetical protein